MFISPGSIIVSNSVALCAFGITSVVLVVLTGIVIYGIGLQTMMWSGIWSWFGYRIFKLIDYIVREIYSKNGSST